MALKNKFYSCMSIHTSNQTNSRPTVLACTIGFLYPGTIPGEPNHSCCSPVLGKPDFFPHFTEKTVLCLKGLGYKKALKDLKTNLPFKKM